MNLELNEARQRHADAASEAAEASAEYARIYTALQHARSESKPVLAIELQTQLALALGRKTLAEQMLAGASARLQGCERRALEVLHAQQVKRYRELCDQLHAQLELLIALDSRAGHAVPRSAGIGGYRVPSFGQMPTDDTGAYKAFIHLDSAKAEQALASLFNPEKIHERADVAEAQ